MFKSTLPLLFVLCLVRSSFATPLLVKREAKSEPSNDISDLIEQSVKGLPKKIEWVQQHLQAVASNILKNTLFGVSGWFIGFTLRMELVLMGDETQPSHLMYPIQESVVEREHRIVATAVADMWMDVSTAEQTNKIVVRVSENVVAELLKNFDPVAKQSSKDSMLRRSTEIFFDNLSEAMSSDEHLSSMYNERKEEAQKKVSKQPIISPPILDLQSSNTEQVDSKELDKMLLRPFMRQALVNKLFISQASKHLEMIFSESQFDTYVMAKSMFELASNPSKKEAVNRLYHEALEKTANILKKNTEESEIRENLFSALQTKFEKDPTLNAELNVIKSKLRKNTVFDGEMFQIQILPL